jgi:integrase
MKLTFKEVADRYLAQPTAHNEKKQKLTVTVAGHLVKEFGAKPVKAFEKISLIDNFIEDLRKQPSKRRIGQTVSNSWVNKHIITMRSILNYAYSKEHINRVPKLSVYPEKKSTVFLKPEQVLRLIDSLDGLRADMVRFAVATGLRASNIRLLKWDQIEPDFSALTVHGEDAKMGEDILIPLNRDAQKVLENRKALNDELVKKHRYLSNGIDHVFVQQVGGGTKVGKVLSEITNKTYRKACDKAGVPAGTTFHTMRHTFASWHIENGTSEMVLMELGGWKDRASLQRYAHLNQAQRKIASSNIEGIL